MRYLRYTAIKVREYHRALHSLDFLACLTRREFKRMYYNGSTPLRAMRMPPIINLYEQHTGLTLAEGKARSDYMLERIPHDIRASRQRRGVCVDCGRKHRGSSFTCVSNI